MNSAYVYLQIYKLFDDSTPIPVDCGTFCGKACCRGDDAGMYLFPGEKKVFDLLAPGWAKIETSNFTYRHENKEKKVPILFCSGKCDRYQRPLACRIFPLTPILDKSGKLKIIIDPRAGRLCPLADSLKISDFDIEFIKNIKRAFLLLTSNKEFYSFMSAYSDYIEEYLKFFNKGD